MSSNRLQPLYLDGVGLPALPEGWSWKRFEDVVHAIPVGRKYDGKAVVADGVTPVIDQSVSGFMGHHNDEPGVMASALHPVFTFANHTCAMRWMTSPFSCIQNVFAFKGDSGFETQYLFYAAQGRVVLEEYKGHAPVFRSMLIPVPPFNEQRNIATFLASLDERITLLRETNATLEAIAQALFKSWFVDFDPVRAKMEGRTPEGMDEATAALFPDGFETSELGEVPRGWMYCSLKEVCSIFDSKRVPLSGAERAKRRGPYPYYGAAALMDYVDEYLFDGIYLLTGEDGSVADEQGFPITQYVWGKFWVNNHAHILQGKAGFSTEHLALALRRVNIQPYITGAVQAKLSQSNMWRINVLHPGQGIAEAFGALIAPLYEAVRANVDQAQTLSSLRDTLLPRLISGQLRLPEAQAATEAALGGAL